jgi:hypothetical protein
VSKFDDTFKEIVEFYPDGMLVLSRRAFTKDEAKNIYAKELRRDIPLDRIKEGWVRWQPTPSDLKDDICGDFCWLTCEEKDKNAQPIWIYE